MSEGRKLIRLSDREMCVLLVKVFKPIPYGPMDPKGPSEDEIKATIPFLEALKKSSNDEASEAWKKRGEES